MSNSLRPHKSQHARLPCPSPTPGVYPNSCPSSWWCHSAISSSVIPFSSCPQSFPALMSFPMSQLFTWGGQSIGVSASKSVLLWRPHHYPVWGMFEMTIPGWGIDSIKMKITQKITHFIYPQIYKMFTWNKEEAPTNLLCLFITAWRDPFFLRKSWKASRLNDPFHKNKGIELWVQLGF